MTQSTASFIDQLEQAAAGKEIVLKTGCRTNRICRRKNS